MAKRMLLVLTSDTTAHWASAARDAAWLTRDVGGTLRMMHTRPLPPPRKDRTGRIVVDTDREMSRIGELVQQQMDTIAAGLDDVAVEAVVRFGRLHEEVAAEVDAFGADVVALAAPPRSSLRHELRAWCLEHMALRSRTPVVLMPPVLDGAREGLRDALALASLRQI